MIDFLLLLNFHLAMGLCKDQALQILANLGYQSVRNPSRDVEPLTLIGYQRRTYSLLGPLTYLLAHSPTDPLPIKQNQPSGDVTGKRSSKLDFSIGASVLGAFVGALGGNLSADVNFTNAERIQFEYLDVLADSVDPIAVGRYLGQGTLDRKNSLTEQYITGSGVLYLVTKTLKSNKFAVTFEMSNETRAAVKVPVLEAAIGANVSVSASSANSSTIVFQGKTPLTFAFQCFELGIENGHLALFNTKAGAVALSAEGEAQPPVVLASHQLLTLSNGNSALHSDS